MAMIYRSVEYWSETKGHVKQWFWFNQIENKNYGPYSSEGKAVDAIDTWKRERNRRK